MIKRLLSIFKKKKVESNFGYIKFDIGDEVKVTIFSEIPEFWYKGKVLDVNARYVVPSIESSWKVEYYVVFINRMNDKVTEWFSELQLMKYSLQEERNSRIEQILN
jgi:heat shock protein HspQ